jgi:hypothetical protein
VKERISLAYEALVDGAKHWWITRESGEGPLCWWQPDSEGSPCGDDALPRQPRACMVIKVALSADEAVVTQHWKLVAISKLDSDSLFITMRHIMPWLRGLSSAKDGCTKRGVTAQEFFSRLDAGMFSYTTGCACTGVAVCYACSRVNINSRRFLVQDRYQGAYPRGRGHWFSGATDAVRDIAHGQLMWLSCCCGPHDHVCTVM